MGIPLSETESSHRQSRNPRPIFRAGACNLWKFKCLSLSTAQLSTSILYRQFELVTALVVNAMYHKTRLLFNNRQNLNFPPWPANLSMRSEPEASS